MRRRHGLAVAIALAVAGCGVTVSTGSAGACRQGDEHPLHPSGDTLADSVLICHRSGRLAVVNAATDLVLDVRLNGVGHGRERVSVPATDPARFPRASSPAR